MTNYSTKIKAKDFFKEFLDKTKDIDIEDYKKCTKYTPKVTAAIKECIEHLGLLSSTEYYRIDVIGYSKPESGFEEKVKIASKLGLKPHLWRLEIAVEHENASDDWTDELTKLLYISCPLRVLICYNHADKRDDSNLGDAIKLQYAAEIIKDLPYWETAGQFLIIVGNCNRTDKINYCKKDYRGYLFDNEEKIFTPISCGIDRTTY